MKRRAKVLGFFVLCGFIAHLSLFSTGLSARLAVSESAGTAGGSDPAQHDDGSGTPLAHIFLDVGAALDRTHGSLSKLSPALRVALTDGSETTILVVLTEQADLSRIAGESTGEAKRRAVYEALRAVARRTQAPLRAKLDAQGVAYRPFYIVNMLTVQGDVALALRLAARPDVARLAANPAVRGDLPATGLERSLAPQGVYDATHLDSVEWGVERIRAEEVWGLGYTGQGIVVAGQDTGYEWDHPALKAQYRGWDGVTVTHDYNWHDAIHEDDPQTSPDNPCGLDSSEPCDDNGHGTHTMGTIVGDDGDSYQIGVAPGARWMGCRNMDQTVGTPASYAECFEFFLAPYPLGGDPMTDGDPSMAPHVINNSWSCPPYEGCDADTLRAIVENVRAAGIVVVASAGNSGPSCGSIGDPIALYDASFTVGATDVLDQIAGFSSRGPVTVGDSQRTKPNISAPGVNVVSSVPGGWYASNNGTSMAAPHVTGLVAMLLSAAPWLIGEVGRTEELIQETARPTLDESCGGDADGRPNNVYGWGIVDALAAVKGASEGLHVSGDVDPLWGVAGGAITYTFTVSNRDVLSPATDVVLGDTIPLSTTFARASGTYSTAGEQVTWSLGAISPNQQMSVTLAVTIELTVPIGTPIVNASYQVHSSEVPTPVIGLPIVTAIPWQRFLPITTKWAP